MQPLEIVRQALQQAPHDVDRYLAWHINNTAPAQRQTLHDRIVGAVSDGRLSGEFDAPIQAPRLFSSTAAEQTWEDLSPLLVGGTDEAALFFKPRGLQFAPQAYPGRWAPARWNDPLTPAEVRQALKLDDDQVNSLKEVAIALIAGAGGNVVPLTGGNGFRSNPLRVGVLPYVDVLPLATLFYAISDQVDGIGFAPATFFHCCNTQQMLPIDDGIFNVGYATAHQLESMLEKNPALLTQEVFSEGFTRSLITRVVLGRDTPQLKLMSFVGEFGPGWATAVLSKSSDPIFAAQKELFFKEEFKITEAIESIVNWEIPLILAFASGVNGIPAQYDGLALSLSTDSHLWAASFGLNLGPCRGRPDPGSEPTFRHAVWNPKDRKNAAPEDRNSKLCWFIPDTGSQATEHCGELAYLLRLITQPIKKLLREQHESHDPERLAHTRKQLSPYARALLSPLLTAIPTYRGPMLSAPPEAWMNKISSPSAYIDYRPTWFGVTPDDATPDAQDAARAPQDKSLRRRA
jgi:hypothetical protein